MSLLFPGYLTLFLELALFVAVLYAGVAGIFFLQARRAVRSPAP